MACPSYLEGKRVSVAVVAILQFLKNGLFHKVIKLTCLSNIVQLPFIIWNIIIVYLQIGILHPGFLIIPYSLITINMHIF